MNNPNYNNNFYRNNFTFQNNLHFLPNLPPPPPILPPPPPILPPLPTILPPLPTILPPPPAPPFINPYIENVADGAYVKSFENKICTTEVLKVKPPITTLSKLKEKIRSLNTAYNNIQIQEQKLNENINLYSDEEWQHVFEDVENNKLLINNILSELSVSYLDLSRRAIAKRSAKRLRLKKLRQKMKIEKLEQIKERQERSRLIDENLKKINDDIQKAKQEEEAKQLADVVLKDVIRKRHEAKKNILKLDALVKLRKARHNTAKGRGVIHCKSEVDFQEHIEKVKLMWIQKLAIYEIEEEDLRAKLNQSNCNECTNNSEKEVIENLTKWHQVMFGGTIAPQVDFQGDIQKFIGKRSEWDRYVSDHGTPIPLEWVLPTR